MTTVTLEVHDEADLHLLLSLAERLNLRSTVVDEDELANFLSEPDGEPLTPEQLAKRLDEAAEQPRISFKEFIRTLESWK